MVGEGFREVGELGDLLDRHVQAAVLDSLHHRHFLLLHDDRDRVFLLLFDLSRVLRFRHRLIHRRTFVLTNHPGGIADDGAKSVENLFRADRSRSDALEDRDSHARCVSTFQPEARIGFDRFRQLLRDSLNQLLATDFFVLLLRTQLQVVVELLEHLRVEKFRRRRHDERDHSLAELGADDRFDVADHRREKRLLDVQRVVGGVQHLQDQQMSVLVDAQLRDVLLDGLQHRSALLGDRVEITENRRSRALLRR